MRKTETDFNSLAERILTLERQNRRWKFASFLLLVVIASSLATGLVAQERIQPPLMRAKTVEAQSFLLKDAGGTIRGQMMMKSGQPTFELYDQGGRVIWSAPAKAQLIPSR